MNAEKTVYTLLKVSSDDDWELVIVDDGSTDNTSEIIKRLSCVDSRIKIVSHRRNLGLGAAIESGFKIFSGEIVVTIDADLSYDPREIKNLLNAFDKHTDVVLGSPYLTPGLVHNISFPRLLISRLGSLVYRLLSGSKISCFTGIFRAYRSHVVRNIKLQAKGFESQAELLINILSKGYRVKEIPAHLGSRLYGVSKFKIRRDFSRHLHLLKKLFKNRFLKYSP